LAPFKHCATVGKVQDTWKSAAHQVKCAALGKIAANLENCETLGKRRSTWKSAPHLEKRGTLERMRHTPENLALLRTCVTILKLQFTGKNVEKKKCSTLGKVRHTCRSVAHLQKSGALKKVRHT